MGTVAQNLIGVRSRVEEACSRAKRDASSIIIVAVSKGRTVVDIREALQAGIRDIGENRVQEAQSKFEELSSGPEAVKARWHMVGHLQTNKVKEAVRIFDLIHSVDSLRLAQEIDKQAGRLGKVQDILLEVKTSPEATKSGIKPDETLRLAQKVSELKNICLKGLMTIAPLADSPEEARLYFKALRELSGSLQQAPVLSMGMTDDFEVAIEEGATMLRLGRVIFER